MNALRHTVLPVGPLCVSGLLVRRCGIMYLRLNAMSSQTFLQLPACRTAHGIYVIYIALGLTGRQRKGDQRILYALVIEAGYLATAVIVLVQSSQLQAQHGCLYLIHAAIDAFVLVHILLLASIVAHGLHHASQLLVVGSHTTRITQCAQILAGIETECGGIGQSAGTQTACAGTMSLCSIIDDLQSVSIGNAADSLHVAQAAVEMHGHDGTCARCDERLYQLLVYEIIAERRFTEYRREAGMRDGQYGGYECIGRHYHLIALVPAQELAVGTQYIGERIKPVGRGHATGHSAIVGIEACKALVLPAMQIPSAVHHPRNLLGESRLEGVGNLLDIQIEHLFLLVSRLFATHLHQFGTLQRHVIHVIAYGSSAKPFLLKNQPFVENRPAMLGGNAEIHVFHLLVTLVDEMAEKQIESAEGATLVARSYILHMSHVLRFKDHRACHYLPVVPHKVELYLLGETLHEQLHLLGAMHGMHMMVCLQHLVQQLPVFIQRLGVALRHTVDIEAVFDGLLGLTQSQRAHLHGMCHAHSRTHLAALEHRAGTEERIELLAAGDITIYIRYRLHHHTLRLEVALVIEQNGPHDAQHIGLRHLGQHYQTAIGESLVGIDTSFTLHPVGWENRHKPPAVGCLLGVTVGGADSLIHHHRAVEEAVGMIIHEPTLQQERSVLRPPHEGVPILALIYRIRYNCHYSPFISLR